MILEPGAGGDEAGGAGGDEGLLQHVCGPPSLSKRALAVERPSDRSVDRVMRDVAGAP